MDCRFFKYVKVISRIMVMGLLVVSCNFIKLKAQGINGDSIIAQLPHMDKGTEEYAKTLVKLSNYYVYNNLDSADHYINQALKYLEIESEKDYHRHYLVKSWVLHGQQRLDSALYFLDRAESIVEEYGDSDDKLEIRINKGALLSHSKNQKAKSYAEYLIEISDVNKGKNDIKQWILGHNYLAQYYTDQFDYTKALELLFQVYRSGYLEEVPAYQLGVIRKISDLATKIGDEYIATAYLNELLNNEHVLEYQKNEVTIDLAKVYLKIDSLDKIKVLLKNLEVKVDINDEIKLSCAHLNAEIALREMNYQKAADNIKIQDSILQYAQNVEYQLKLKDQKVRSFKLNGNSDEAIAVIKQAFGEDMSLQDSIIFLRHELEILLNSRLATKFRNLMNLESDLKSRESKELSKRNLIAFEVEKKELLNSILAQKVKSEELKKIAYKQKMYLLSLVLLLALLLMLVILKNYRANKKLNSLLKLKNEKLVFKASELEKINGKLRLEISKTKNVKNEVLIDLKSRDKIHRVDVDKILYVKAETPGIRIYMDNTDFWADHTLGELQSIISDQENFVQCFRSTIINIDYLSWINHSSLKMTDGTELRIGRTYKKILQAKFMN